MRRLCPLLCINEQEKSDKAIQILFWRPLYGQIAAHVDQLQAASDRLVTEAGNTPDDSCRRRDDMALFMDSFLTRHPFDMPARLQSTQSMGH